MYYRQRLGNCRKGKSKFILCTILSELNPKEFRSMHKFKYIFNYFSYIHKLLKINNSIASLIIQENKLSGKAIKCFDKTHDVICYNSLPCIHSHWQDCNSYLMIKNNFSYVFHR